jgi:hypothetical protein
MAFLWTGTEMVDGGKCLVTWTRVQCPLQLGGLGVLDLKLMGCAVCLCWLWLQWVDPSKPWAALPLHEDAMTKAFFKTSIRCIVGNGQFMLFWLDPWMDGRCIVDLAPDLMAAVHPRRRNSRTVAIALSQYAWLCDIVGALTFPVLMQYV